MPTCPRFALTLLTVSTLLSTAGVAQAAHRGPARPEVAEAPAPTTKAQVVVHRAVACIMSQNDGFKFGLQDFFDALDKLATDVNNNTPEQDILDFADDFTKKLLDAQLKTSEKINLIADVAIKRLTRIGADPSLAMAVKSAQDAALNDIKAAVDSMLAQLEVSVEKALAVAAQPDSPA